MAPLEGRIGLIYGINVFLLWAVGTGADLPQLTDGGEMDA